ncbi:MAG: hypothetical protein ACKO7C_03660, partial [Bacteroidota bacterium]
MIPCVKIKAGKDQSIKRFHPWVFSGAVASISELLSEGQLVEVVDHNENTLPAGFAPCASICFTAARAISQDCVTLASITSRKRSG